MGFVRIVILFFLGLGEFLFMVFVFDVFLVILVVDFFIVLIKLFFEVLIVILIEFDCVLFFVDCLWFFFL